MMIWIIIGTLLLTPVVGVVIYGMIVEPTLRWSILFTIGTLGGIAALIQGLTQR